MTVAARTVSLSLILATLVCCPPGMAQDAAAAVELSPAALRAKALLALRQGNSQLAVEAADGLLARDSDHPASMLLAADVYLRCGRIDDAVKWFDHYLKSEPEALPELWQRGIALYFAGDYKRAASQFEEHRKVNPHDVENAAWHFLCVAKSDSMETARRLVLPAPNDPRVPMAEVLSMLSNGDTDAVRRRMQESGGGRSATESAEFYGNFYLGLYADAGGDQADALSWLKKSASNAPHHYMGDVARVYLQFLREQVDAGPAADATK